MLRTLSLPQRAKSPAISSIPCEHRAVSKDGRIICCKIVEGDNRISPDLCNTCPFKAVNCTHLRFSLRKSSPSPLVVRFNGRTEVWDDDPPVIHFRQAACSERVVPIESPLACASCAQCQPVQPEVISRPKTAKRRRTSKPGKVVPFPQRESVLATA